jgi:hypothetical protein
MMPKPPRHEKAAARGRLPRSRGSTKRGEMTAPSRYLAVEIAETELLLDAAREGAATDAQLDGLRAFLQEGEGADPGRLAAAALALGRAGRARDRSSIEALARRASEAGHLHHAAAIRLAADIGACPPPPWVERAEAGYRRTDPVTEEIVYVEDPLAAYWHRRGRWGPPIRPCVEEPGPVLAEVEDEAALAAALDGRLVRVDFAPRGLERLGPWLAVSGLAPAPASEAAVWLTRAGIARDRALFDLERWSEIRALNIAERRGRRWVAVQGPRGLRPLPPSAAVPAERLLGFMDALAQRART